MTAGRQNRGEPAQDSARSESEARSRSEFGGAAGNLALLVGLPAATFYLYFCVRFNDGRLIPGPGVELGPFAASLLPSWAAAGVYLGWLAFQALLQAFAPGRSVEGAPLEDGTRLRYRMNGRSSFLITAAALALVSALACSRCAGSTTISGS